jgi:hypothetical protein
MQNKKFGLLLEFKFVFKKALASYMRASGWKKQASKILCNCPFNKILKNKCFFSWINMIGGESLFHMLISNKIII